MFRLGHSSCFLKCSKFYAHLRNGIKNPKNAFRFSDKGVWSCCRKFCLYRQEYLSSAVNVLASRLKIYDHIKAVFFQLYLPEIHGGKG